MLNVFAALDFNYKKELFIAVRRPKQTWNNRPSLTVTRVSAWMEKLKGVQINRQKQTAGLYDEGVER